MQIFAADLATNTKLPNPLSLQNNFYTHHFLVSWIMLLFLTQEYSIHLKFYLQAYYWSTLWSCHCAYLYNQLLVFLFFHRKNYIWNNIMEVYLPVTVYTDMLFMWPIVKIWCQPLDSICWGRWGFTWMGNYPKNQCGNS